MNELFESSYISVLTEQNDKLRKQLEAYENMRKEVNIFIEKKQKLGALNYVDINELLNILNKVGEDNE